MGVILQESFDFNNVTGLQSHSAYVKPGNWFYILGDPSSAMKYIPEVEMRGAIRIIAPRDSLLDTELPITTVDDVRLKYLQDCSIFYEDLFDNFNALISNKTIFYFF